MMRWIIIAVVILLVLFGWRSCRESGRTDVVDGMSAAADSMWERGQEMAGDVASSVREAAGRLGDFVERKLPDGSTLRVPERGIESRVIAFVEDTSRPVSDTMWFNFDRLNFGTGSAVLSEDSDEQLDNIASMMKAYPKASIKIGGYTDNTGNADANKKLSQDRANAVRQELIDRGIAANRLEAEGYGDAHPVASNDTEEGRAQNRRIALRVTAK